MNISENAQNSNSANVQNENDEKETIQSLLKALRQSQDENNIIQQKYLKLAMNKENQSHTKSLLDEQRLSEFTGKFPKNQSEYYSFSSMIANFVQNHRSISEESILRKIIKSLKTPIQAQWNGYQLSKYRENLTMNSLINTESERIKYYKINNNINHFEQFIIHKLQIRPTINYFNKKLNYIVTLKNENPSDTLSRINRYFFEIETVRNKLNPSMSLKLRKYDIRDKVEHIMRVFITDNNVKDHDNDGRLNEKVKNNMSKFIKKTAGYSDKQRLEKLSDYINVTLSDAVLPYQESNKDGYYWQYHEFDVSVFELTRISAKRERDDESENKSDNIINEPPTKKIKVLRNSKCWHSAVCGKYIRTGHCQFSHTKDEIESMNEIRNDSKPKSPKSDHASKLNSEKTVKTGVCRKGSRCDFVQRGACRYSHNMGEIQCRRCRNFGHGYHRCPMNKTTNDPMSTPNQSILRYDPQKRLNPPHPNPHSLTMHPMTTPIPNDINTQIAMSKAQIKREHERYANLKALRMKALLSAQQAQESKPKSYGWSPYTPSSKY